MTTEFFSGSYLPEDVTFLLRQTDIALVDVETKEKLLQAGKRHYSEMLSREDPPTATHMQIYRRALETGAPRLARETLALARAIAAQAPQNPVILASLARAGVPLGVLLTRALRFLGREARHFGVSIIRDRGIDRQAMAHIRQKYPGREIFFVDGWTGKGMIARELYRAIPGARLVVLADPCGMAWLAAGHDDWLIPFGILGAPVSGLISRTLWAEEDFHGCLLWEELRPWEQSRAFADYVAGQWTAAMPAHVPEPDFAMRGKLAENSRRLVGRLMAEYGVSSLNRIKPGIAEAARALLRRVPERVLISSLNDEDTRLVRHLAERRNVRVEEKGALIAPYRAVTIIKKA